MTVMVAVVHLVPKVALNATAVEEGSRELPVVVQGAGFDEQRDSTAVDRNQDALAVDLDLEDYSQYMVVGEKSEGSAFAAAASQYEIAQEQTAIAMAVPAGSEAIWARHPPCVVYVMVPYSEHAPDQGYSQRPHFVEL